LVVTISNVERQKFLTMAIEEGLDAISYGNGITPKQAALVFRDENKGDVLVGTAANYAEGLDLPKQTAPVIFFLKPGYPNPQDPGTIFEVKRWGGQRWALWNWRVMQQALQVRGRNVRSRSDIGVCFFISQQFRRVLFAALPEWLKKAYRRDFTFEQCLADAEKLLS
jgi:Rad3-related DNA helicase